MAARLLLLPIVASLAACAVPAGQTPSLAPRAAEAIDPRVPVVAPLASTIPDAALAAQLALLVARAREGDAAFRPAAGEAERLAAGAGDPESESWVVAQQALSAAVAARGLTTRAMGDIDAIAAVRLARQGGIAPADLAAITRAADEVEAIDRGQAALIDRLQRRLGG